MHFEESSAVMDIKGAIDAVVHDSGQPFACSPTALFISASSPDTGT